MFDTMYTMNLVLQVLRRLKWVFVVWFYWLIFWALGGKALLILIPCFALSAGAYLGDKTRESRSMDDFSGGRLFFRYGEQVDFTSLPIPINHNWSFGETQGYAQKLRLALARKISDRLPENLVQVLGEVVVTDQTTGEKKEFLRVCVRSRFGSLLTHFVHCADFGQTITAHFLTYIRGTYSDWDVAKFMLLSPFTLWFWGISWLLNRYSIISHLSVYRASSYDGIDLRTMFCLTNKVVYEEAESLLTEAGLITEQIRAVIQNSIYNNFGTGQQVNNSSFRDVNQGKPAMRTPRLQSV
ncbi:MAG TPA: hypothetical protein VGG20_27675 [Thermoanaerobaculia bacterium]|jgi:hypothetical protein